MFVYCTLHNEYIHTHTYTQTDTDRSWFKDYNTLDSLGAVHQLSCSIYKNNIVMCIHFWFKNLQLQLRVNNTRILMSIGKHDEDI